MKSDDDEERSDDRGRTARQRRPNDLIVYVIGAAATLTTGGGAWSFKSVSDQLQVLVVGMARLEEKVASVTKLEDRVRGLEHDVAELNARAREQRGK